MFHDFQKHIASAERPLILRILRRIRPLSRFVEAFLPKVWILEGVERNSEQPLRVVFAGEVANKNYIADLVFGASCVERLLGRRWVWRVADQRDPKKETNAVVITEMGQRVRRMFGAAYDYHVPCWVGGTIDVTKFVVRLQSSRSVKEDMRRLRKLNLSWEIGKDACDFDEFFRDMYLPYVVNAYGDMAFPMSREAMMASAAKSEIFFVKMEGRRVAGQLLVYENGGVRAWSLGVLDGDRSFVDIGVVKAMHFHLLTYLAEQGFRTVHFGGSRPFLRDGVLKYKRHLGLCLIDHSPRSFAVTVPFGSVAATAFLCGNPFVQEINGEYWGVVAVQQGTPDIDQSVAALHKVHSLPGLNGLSILVVPSHSVVTSVHPQVSTQTASADSESAGRHDQHTHLPQQCA